jgi:transposase-like protein
MADQKTAADLQEELARALRRSFPGRGAVAQIARAVGVGPSTASDWYYGRTPVRGPQFIALMAASPEFEREVLAIIGAKRAARPA